MFLIYQLIAKMIKCHNGGIAHQNFLKPNEFSIRIELQTSCNATKSSLYIYMLKLRFKLSTEKLSPLSSWMWKMPSSVELCAHINLHSEGSKPYFWVEEDFKITKTAQPEVNVWYVNLQVTVMHFHVTHPLCVSPCAYLIGTSAEPWAGHWDCWCCPSQAGRPRLLLPVRQRHDTTLSCWKSHKPAGLQKKKKKTQQETSCQKKQTAISRRSLSHNWAKQAGCLCPWSSWAEADRDDLPWASDLHIQPARYALTLPANIIMTTTSFNYSTASASHLYKDRLDSLKAVKKKKTKKPN